MTPNRNTAYMEMSARPAVGEAIGEDDFLVNDALGSTCIADSSGLDEEMENGDAKWANFPTRED